MNRDFSQSDGSTYSTGIFTIKDKVMKIDGKVINISQIGSTDFKTFQRHSLFSGLKEWVYGFIFVAILAAIWEILAILFTFYLFTIVLLFVYNYNEHKKQFYGLEILIVNEVLWLKSDHYDFIQDVEKALADAMSSKNANYTINMDNRVINNGIISKGNNNKNKVGSTND